MEVESYDITFDLLTISNALHGFDCTEFLLRVLALVVNINIRV